MNAEKFTQKTIETINTAQAMAQENGNQKRAAERLKIGRSTLWRMLKNDAKE